MEDLKEDIKNFLTGYNLPNQWIVDEKNWLKFIILFTKILVDQPINNPADNIKCFSLYPAADNCVNGKIEFKKAIEMNGEKYEWYKFGNVY